MTARPWTDADREALAALLAWYTVPEVARMLGRSRSACADVMRRQGIKAQVIHGAAGDYRPCTNAEIQYVLGSLERGRSLAQLARTVGRSKHALNVHLLKRGYRSSQGTISATSIAREYDVHNTTVTALADSRLRYVRSTGSGNGKRYRFTDDQAAELRRILDGLTGRTARRRAA
jgi:hypothetical protein